MKTVKYIILSAAIPLFFSCESFIDNKPSAEEGTSGDINVTNTSKYTNKEKAYEELNGAYNALKSDIYQFEVFITGDVQSDNCYMGSDDPAHDPIDKLTLNSMNEIVRMNWQEHYAVASIATSVVGNTELLDKDLISDTERNQIIAEAKFVRAFAYFSIVRQWGDAPLTLNLIPAINSKNIEEVYPLYYPARTPADTIYAAIINDLTTAIPYLSSVNQGVFKATKGSAYGLLAKAYATRGAKATRDYNKVVENCDKVIAEGYKLLPDYASLWVADNKGTAESIFELTFTSQQGNWAYWVLLKEEDGTVSWKRYCTPTEDLLAKYESGDTRKNATFIWKEAPYQGYYPSDNYPFAYKIKEKYSSIVLLRLADMILLKAEALVELNQIPQAIDLVNQIRNRAGLTQLASTLSQGDARLAVEKERQLELALEGHRWYDLVRNERMVEVMSQHKGFDGKPFIKNVQPFRALWPIPQEEKDINFSLTQNEGY